MRSIQAQPWTGWPFSWDIKLLSPQFWQSVLAPGIFLYLYIITAFLASPFLS